MVDACIEITQKHYQKNNMEQKGGTWDSNPGPRGYQYARLPLEPNARFEYIMTTNYYKRKVVSDAKITKSAR